VKEPSADEFSSGASNAPSASAASRLGRARLEERTLASRLRLPLMLGGVALVVILAAVFYFTGGRYESTDDAYVRAAGVDVSSNLSGRVIEVDVRENQAVRKGDVLFRLDPAPYDIAIEQAQAQLANARQDVQGQLAAYHQRQVELKNAQDDAAYRERERGREQGLLAAGAISQAEYDQARRAADAARLQIGAAQQQLAAALAAVGGVTTVDSSTHAGVREASAQLAHAELQKSWTVIRAPQDGRVTKVEQLQVGDYINAAAPVFHLVAPRMWVEAAFKENQLKHMRVGEPATITVDAYPGHTFDAVVDSLAPGTDQTFSLLPAENATGNWVKVVQRLPVRLTFVKPPQIALQGGLSAKVKVDTGYRRGLTGSHPAR
jgi:membrane fusion protein (multidrug efflux system)